MRTVTSPTELKFYYRVGFRYIKNVGFRYVVARRKINSAVKIKSCLESGTILKTTEQLFTYLNKQKQ